MNSLNADLLALIYKSKLSKYLENNIELNSNNFLVDYCISNYCNLECQHCYFGSFNVEKSDLLSLNAWKNLAQELIKRGIKHHHFSGKESSLDKRTLKLIQFIRSKSPESFIGIITNGTGHKDYYDEVLKYIDYIEVSVDGLEYYHDSLRGQKAYAKTYEFLQYAVSSYPVEKIIISTSCYQDNFSTYLELLEHFSALGIKKFFINEVIPEGNARFMINKILTKNDFCNLITDVYSFLKFCSTNIHVKFCIQHETIPYIWYNNGFLSEFIKRSIYEGKELTEEVNGSYFEISPNFLDIKYLNQLCIGFDGNIYACPTDISSDIIPFANVKKDDLDSILNLRKLMIYDQLKILKRYEKKQIYPEKQ